MELTQNRLRSVLSYDEKSGVFIWKAYKAGIKHGSRAGYADKRGAVFIRIDGSRHSAHRLAWLYVYGKFPDFEIDHINGNPGDNRISNLRDVPHIENQQNFREAFSTNKSAGLLGVSLHKKTGLWRARITARNKEFCLGYFKSPDVAHAAYVSAKRQLHEGCTI